METGNEAECLLMFAWEWNCIGCTVEIKFSPILRLSLHSEYGLILGVILYSQSGMDLNSGVGSYLE